MRSILAVVIGGAAGTGLRVLLDAVIPHTDTTFPWSTLLINIVGSFALGVLVARVWPVAPAWLKAGLGAGFMGSFTTFSAFAVSLVTLTRAGLGGIAVVYLVVSVGAGLVAAALGLRFGRRPEPMERNE
jgi:fluoride exporter